jgi:hypothetical protein
MLLSLIIFLIIVFIFLWFAEDKLDKLSSNGTYFFLFCLLAVYLVVEDARRKIRYENDTYLETIESFTPRVREMYRPYLREARIYTQGLISNKRDDFNRLYRQFGLS